MIAWIDVMVEVNVGFESELSNVTSRTYWRPGAMQENEFNQWYMGDCVREEIRAGRISGLGYSVTCNIGMMVEGKGL